MSTTTSPDMNKLELFVNSAVNTYKAVFDHSDWEKMEQLLATHHVNPKSRRTASVPASTIIAALLAVAVLGAIIYQLSRKGVSPDIETTPPAPVEVKQEPVKPPVKSKLDEIVPEKDDSAAETEQLINKDTGTLPEPVIETKKSTNTATPAIVKSNTVSPATENKNTTTSKIDADTKNNTVNTAPVNKAQNTSNTTNSGTGYTKPPPSALTILYNKRKREKRLRDSVQRTIVPTKTIGSDIKEPDNLQMKSVEEPKLKGLNNMYKKSKSDSTPE